MSWTPSSNNSLIVEFVSSLTWDVMFISPHSGDRLDGWLSGPADFIFSEQQPLIFYMTALHLISVICSFVLLPQFVLYANSPPMYLPSLISVRLPSVINFTCLPFIFGTLSRIPYTPRPPSKYSRVVFSITYLTSTTIVLHPPESFWSQCWSGSPWALSRLLALFHCCHYASRSL